jgi:hypothetical protein
MKKDKRKMQWKRRDPSKEDGKMKSLAIRDEK